MKMRGRLCNWKASAYFLLVPGVEKVIGGILYDLRSLNCNIYWWQFCLIIWKQKFTKGFNCYLFLMSIQVSLLLGSVNSINMNTSPNWKKQQGVSRNIKLFLENAFLITELLNYWVLLKISCEPHHYANVFSFGNN